MGLDAPEAWLPRSQYDPFPKSLRQVLVKKGSQEEKLDPANRVLKTEFDRHLVRQSEPDYA